MTMPQWPSDLPVAPLAERYQESLADTVLRSAMEQGPAKLRQRSTAGVGLIEMSYILSGAQAAVLETFYRETLAGGAARFTLTHPRRGTTVTARFRKPPMLTPRNGTYYQARVELEVLP